MDFKPYTEVVLPPEKGTGIPGRQPGSSETKEPAPSGPREYILPAKLRDSKVPPEATETEPPVPSEGTTEGPSADTTGGLSEDTTEGPRENGETQAPPCPARKKTTPEPYRDFIIAYDGAFIGHFRSAKRITNRTAFRRVAQELHASMDDFDMEKLQLYRPVPLDVPPPDTLPDAEEESFCWLSRKRTDLSGR